MLAGLIIGLLIGCLLGVFCTALVTSNKQAEQRLLKEKENDG